MCEETKMKCEVCKRRKAQYRKQEFTLTLIAPKYVCEKCLKTLPAQWHIAYNKMR